MRGAHGDADAHDARNSPRQVQRVLLVLAVADGGVGYHVKALEQHLTDRGMHVQVACPASTQRVFNFRNHQHLNVELGRRPLDAPRVLRFLRARHADVVHAHGLRAGVLSALGGTPSLVVTWHNAQLNETAFNRSLERLVARRATLTLAASDDLGKRARQLGARDVRFVPVAAPERRAEGVDLDLGSPLVLAVGRLAPQKGYEVLIAALPAFPDAVVAVAGEGPLRGQLEQLAPQVRWLGRRSDVADLYAAADVVVLPSLWEARSLTAQETLRAGRPLVATAVGGLPALLGDGALLVPPNDPQALGAAVRSLLDDPARAGQLAARGRQVAASWPDQQSTWQQIETAYLDAFNRDGFRRSGRFCTRRRGSRT